MFVESLLLQIPILPFHLVVADDNTWQVVDGLQRLKALKRFVLDQQMALTGLESLTQFEEKTFTQLPAAFQRKITDTPLTIRLIEKRTPQKLVFNIFYRLNMAR